MKQNNSVYAVIAWSAHRLCFDVLGHYFTKGGAEMAAAAERNRETTKAWGWEIEVVSEAKLERLLMFG